MVRNSTVLGLGDCIQYLISLASHGGQVFGLLICPENLLPNP